MPLHAPASALACNRLAQLRSARPWRRKAPTCHMPAFCLPRPPSSAAELAELAKGTRQAGLQLVAALLSYIEAANLYGYDLEEVEQHCELAVLTSKLLSALLAALQPLSWEEAQQARLHKLPAALGDQVICDPSMAEVEVRWWCRWGRHR
jgi:hypothetical protein